ncbi:MAG: hypothetical protein ACI89Z_000025 [Porticoccus sp.]|jgi:hypothetical protein
MLNNKASKTVESGAGEEDFLFFKRIALLQHVMPSNYKKARQTSPLVKAAHYTLGKRELEGCMHG